MLKFTRVDRLVLLFLIKDAGQNGEDGTTSKLGLARAESGKCEASVRACGPRASCSSDLNSQIGTRTVDVNVA